MFLAREVGLQQGVCCAMSKTKTLSKSSMSLCGLLSAADHTNLHDTANSTAEIHTVRMQLLEWWVVEWWVTLHLYRMHTIACTGVRKQTKLVCTCTTSTTVCTGVEKQTKLVCTCTTVCTCVEKQTKLVCTCKTVCTCVGKQTKLVKVVCTYMYNSMYRCGETKLVCTCTTVCTVLGNKLNLYAHVQQYVQAWGNKMCLHLYISVQVWGDGCTC